MTPATTTLVSELTERQLVQLHELFEQEWWTKGRSLDEVRDVVANSQVVVAIVDSDSADLLGFLRVLTDYRFFSVILDVVVHVGHRGRGLGRVLMDATLAHPDLQRVKGIGLQCEEQLKDFYRRWGFDDSPGRSGPMKLVFPDR